MWISRNIFGISFLNILKLLNIFKAWWNEECNMKLNIYHASKSLADWKDLKGFVKKTKRSFFNKKIQEIVSKNKQPWNLMNWVKKCKLPAIEALHFNRCPCIELENLWQALYLMSNSAQNQHINSHLLNEIPSKPLSERLLFFKVEFNDVINKCSSLSTPGDLDI